MTLTVPDGALLVLVGPSGCGKTTILRMIAGLEDVTQGSIHLGEREITYLPPKDRDLAMVFQNYALYPHMSVYKNIAFALKLRHVPRATIDKSVRETAATLGLSDLLDRKPRSLSGGQRQRVAMGRAIVRSPQGFLMDEPLSNLDAKLRVQMRADISRIQSELGVTTVYVTHDQTEAMTMGDLVAVLRDGVVQQLAPPQTLYKHPKNLFVGGFIGSPAMNCLRARLLQRESRAVALFGDTELELDEGVFRERPELQAYIDRDVIIGMRPEDLEDADCAPNAPPGSRIRVGVHLVESLGSETYVHFSLRTPSKPDKSKLGLLPSGDPGSGDDGLMVARVSPRSRAMQGSMMEVVASSEQLHFFDCESGEGIY